MPATTKDDKIISNHEKHDQVLNVLKQQVKAIMEEAVTKKFIYEESPHVLRMCGTVEKCLLDGLKKSGLFLRPNKIANLYAKVRKKVSGVTELISQIEMEEMKLKKSAASNERRASVGTIDSSASPVNGNGSSSSRGKYLWIRVACNAKILDKIAEYIVQNHKKFYESTSIMADPVRGKIFAFLLVGPCALDYTKVKTHDHYWSDPPADELLQRHKLHSRGYPNSPTSKRPTLHFSSLRHTSSSDSIDRGSGFRDYVESLHQNSKVSLLYGKNNVTIQPDEVGPVPGYLSLHQEGCRLMIKWIPNQLMNGNDSKTKLENGVIRENGNHVKDVGPDGEDDDVIRPPRRRIMCRRVSQLKNQSRSYYWDFAISVDVEDIYYLHCHQSDDRDGVLVLVGRDGVQWPPIRFPPGAHLLAFLTCLETALLPNGRLEPPLWSQKGEGKIFPRLRRKSSRRVPSSGEEAYDENPTDFVFRVQTNLDVVSPDDGTTVTSHVDPPEFDLLQPVSLLPLFLRRSARKRGRSDVITSGGERNPHSTVAARRFSDSPLDRPNGRASPPHVTRESSRRSSRMSSFSSDKSDERNRTGDQEAYERLVPNLDVYAWNQAKPRRYNEILGFNGNSSNTSGTSLKMLCESMRRQIISRAFYGWLAHCRHMESVRTYLTGLVNLEGASPDTPTDATVGITEEVWSRLFQNGKLTSYEELCRFVYFGGIRFKEKRPIIWLYLLGFYRADSDRNGRRNTEEEARSNYKKIRIVDGKIKLMYTGKAGLSSDVSMTSRSEVSSVSSSDFSSKKPMLKQQSSVLSDVFIPDPEPCQDQDQLPARMSDFIEENGDDVSSTGSSPSLQEKRKSFKRFYSEEKPTSTSVPSSILSRSVSLEDGLKHTRISNGKKDHPPVEDRLPSTMEGVDFDDLPHGGAKDGMYSLNEKRTKMRTSTFGSDSSDFISVNLTQIQKDVFRCDRNHHYFTKEENLDKLSNIMSCYVWEHPEPGYVQGMCDLAAPLLVLLDDESLVYSCFVKLMEQISFQKGNSMDVRLANLRSITQVLDYELYEYLHKATDSSHFFFCYRWFLLEFKRELSYDEDVFAMWECTWAARSCATDDFGLFVALAMLQNYRDIIMENELDFSGIVKFFNEMAEKHDADTLLSRSRRLVADVQKMFQK